MNNIVKILLTILGILLLAYLVTSAYATQDETCPKTDNWTKVDGVMPSHNTEGSIITQVCVKGGQDKVFFTENGDNDCWKVMGIGTTSAYAEKIGEGRTCKDISHASFFVGTTTSLTVSPTEGISPTITPTEEITPQVTKVDEPTPIILQPSATRSIEHPSATPFHPTPTVYFEPYVEQEAPRGGKGS